MSKQSRADLSRMQECNGCSAAAPERLEKTRLVKHGKFLHQTSISVVDGRRHSRRGWCSVRRFVCGLLTVRLPASVLFLDEPQGIQGPAPHPLLLVLLLYSVQSTVTAGTPSRQGSPSLRRTAPTLLSHTLACTCTCTSQSQRPDATRHRRFLFPRVLLSSSFDSISTSSNPPSPRPPHRLAASTDSTHLFSGPGRLSWLYFDFRRAGLVLIVPSKPPRASLLRDTARLLLLHLAHHVEDRFLTRPSIQATVTCPGSKDRRVATSTAAVWRRFGFCSAGKATKLRIAIHLLDAAPFLHCGSRLCHEEAVKGVT